MSQKSKILSFLRILLVTYVLTGVLLFVLAFLLYKFKLKEAQVSIGVMIIYLVTCLIGGLAIGKRMKSKRLVWGLLTGLCYFLILLGASLLMNKGLNQDIRNAVTTLLVCAGGGALGGMLS